MAKFAISPEGIDCLQKLSHDLTCATHSIDDAGRTLYNSIEGCADGLGIYEKEVLLLLRQIFETNKQGKDAVEQLTSISIPKQILQIEKLLLLFSDFGDSDDDEEPPQKKLVLKRR